MSNVYVVSVIDWEYSQVKAVFVSQEQAQAYCNANQIDEDGVEQEFKVEVFPLEG